MNLDASDIKPDVPLTSPVPPSLCDVEYIFFAVSAAELTASCLVPSVYLQISNISNNSHLEKSIYLQLDLPSSFYQTTCQLLP